MENKIDFFENGDYKFVVNLINEKMPILKNIKDFNDKYTRLYDLMEDFENDLNNEQKQKFNEIISLFYNVEEYYVSFAYSLGIKYGRDLEKI